MKKFLWILILLSITNLNYGQIPQTISYQGVLIDAAGTIVPDGNYSLTFKLYDAATGGSPLWSEGQLTAINKGVFNVILGSINPITLPFNKPYWLGVTVGAETELAPRIQLTSSPYSLNARSIMDSVVTSANLRNGAITTEKLADKAVTSDKIADGTITSAKLAPGTNLPPGGNAGGDLSGKYPNPTIAAGVITAAKLADKTITTDKIADGAITSAKLAPGSSIPPGGNAGGDLTGTYPNPTIAAGVVSSTKLADNAITNVKIANNAITTTKIADGAVTSAKLAPGSSIPPGGTAGGDLTGTYPNPTIAAGVVSTIKLADNAVTNAKISNNAITTTKIADGAITSAKLASGTGLPPSGAAGGDLTGTYPNPTIATGVVSTTKLGDNAVTNEKIANNAVTTTKIADGAITSAKIAVGTGLPPSGTAGGDLTGTYPNPTVAANAVITTKLADNAITSVKIADGAVTTGKIANDAVTNAKIANNAVTTTKIADGAITSAKIAAGTGLPPGGTAGGDLTGTYPNPTIAANAVSSTKLADNAVTSAKITDGTITGSDINTTTTITAGRLQGGGTLSGSVGVYGYSASDNAIYGKCASGTGYGVWGQSTSGNFGCLGNNQFGLYAKQASGGNYAGYFHGNVYVLGTVTKTAGSFVIDHPLDPANKYLYHSFVESPDMMNVYNGNAILDANGETMVELPSYFEALNSDYRYQLTPIGGSAPNLYIAEEIAGNHFKIAGGKPGIKVSWQVTGIRQDPYAKEHRIIPEVEKPREKQGKYLYPKEYRVSETLGIDYNEQN